MGNERISRVDLTETPEEFAANLRLRAREMVAREVEHRQVQQRGVGSKLAKILKFKKIPEPRGE